MGKTFAMLFVSFIAIIIINFSWGIVNLYFFISEGFQTIVVGSTFVENIVLSTYLKWILLIDALWIIFALVFTYGRKSYKSDPSFHYLTYNKIEKPSLCVVIPAYNEEESIERVVIEFKKQDFVDNVLGVDNHSSDNTVNIAKRCGANVISKDHNIGYAHSWWMGLSEALKLDGNIIVIVDSDATYNAYDLQKMIPYLDNCDMVVGNRLVQSLNESETQINTFLAWGNAFIAKLFQIKYFNVHHLGIVHLNDVGCSFRCFRKESLKKIINEFKIPNTDKLAFGCNYITVGMFCTAKVIEKNLKIVEVPITFKKRVGKSKTDASKLSNSLYYGFSIIWYILKS